MNLVFLFSFAAGSCPKAPEIANGHVEYSVRYQCDKYYKLRAGNGKPGPMPPGPPVPTPDCLETVSTIATTATVTLPIVCPAELYWHPQHLVFSIVLLPCSSSPALPAPTSLTLPFKYLLF